MSKNLVIYYSRKGQNYMNGKIVELEKGNTELTFYTTTAGIVEEIEYIVK